MQEKLCNRKGCNKPRYPGKKWCSSECHARSAGGTATSKNVPTTTSANAGESSSKARGVASLARSASRPSELGAIANGGGLTTYSENESGRSLKALPPPPQRDDDSFSSLERNEPRSTELAKSAESETQTESESSDLGIEQPAPAASSTSEITETDETQRELSTERLLTPEQERYVQTSLVDDAIGRLHLQIKRLTFDPNAPVVHGKKVDVDDNAEIIRSKLACATATAMARLLKTKLEAARLFNT